MTRDTLPAVGTMRWVARRKAEVVAAVRGGLLTVDEVCQRYNLTMEEFAGWQHGVERAGLKGLHVTRTRSERARHDIAPQAAFHTTSVKRADRAADDAAFRRTIEGVNLETGGDGRNASRFSLLWRVAKLACDGDEQYCIIRDASTTGLKVKLFAPLRHGGQLDVELANGERHPARCVWADGDSVGLQFLEPIALDRLTDPAGDSGRRRHPRLRRALDGVLHLGETTADISFHDISPHGAAFKTDKLLLIDELVMIETGIFPTIYAKVRWRDHPHYGVIFEQNVQLETLHSK
jgi:hypothetical protein